MSKSEEQRPLSWLRERVLPLAELPEEAMEVLLALAGKYRPTTAAKKAAEILRLPLQKKQRTQVIRATRWLAMVRRDYGEQEFQRLARSLRERGAAASQQQPHAERSRGQGERAMKNLAAVMIVFVILAAACSGPPSASDIAASECVYTSDCPPGEYCYAGACRQGCLDDADCPTDFGFICDRASRRCSCLDGPAGQCEEPPPCISVSEICDGADNDCDGQTDEGNVCCVPRDEDCDDGLDNDCDGLVDSADSDCEVADGGTTDDGAVDDTPSCVPEPEICDSVDNDCDGLTDEGGVCDETDGGVVDQDPSDPCSPSMYGDGVCDDFCLDPDPDCGATDGGTVDEGAPDDNTCIPEPEICDSVDNDCDGEVDEDCSELCGDGVDNDGDGLVDEGFDDMDSTCYVGLGECRRQGVVFCSEDELGLVCLDTELGDVLQPGEPASELCDGVDNDCDGEVDEGFQLESDPLNCGVCGNVCASGESCVAGECKYVPQECQELFHDPSFENEEGGFNESQPTFNGWHVEEHLDDGREVSYSFVSDEDGTPDGRVFLRVENTLPGLEWKLQLQQLEQFQVGETYAGSVYLRADSPCRVWFQVMDHWDWSVPAFTFQSLYTTSGWQHFQQSFSVEQLASGHPYRVALMLGECSAVEVDYFHLYRTTSCE